ncbi:GspE/PulE family protein [uncultured Fusobacterium sp.]|uniref:GspE/PulE family protein n=1 Tax=uncultured Fusobacterium sp. TaxID=159267 RepID=UPI0025D1D59D|nr:GspE/PulE family protein [uncultured Fusobacterium sp.]
MVKTFKSKNLENNNLDIETLFKEVEKSYSTENIKYLKKRDSFLREENSVVAKIVNTILRRAIEEKASDIHIESYREYIRIRYRIDGVLIEIGKIKGIEFLQYIISRIKIIADLDIVERRMPQDGRFEINIQDKKIDFRVSIIPTINGEKCVIRILNQNIIDLDIEKLDIDKSDLEKILFQLNKRNGMLLISGPTGSGKTSTLYSILKRLNTGHENILTVEDPVEYEIAGINQVQSKNEIGRTFAVMLRAYLRQDPDILMVGEIRDYETAEIAVKASITGHMVLSTIHTNNSVGGIDRLIDIGIPAYMISASLSGIISQRLVRRLCSDCKIKDEYWKEKIKILGYDLENYKNIEFYTEKGCPKCNHTGYRGRIGIFEVFIPDIEIKNMINKEISSLEIEKVALKKGMKKLLEDGIKKAEEGITSLNELLRQY